MENVAVKIGDDYKKWENGDKIFISSPTGSGKTYFVLHKLLPHYASQNQKVLYLVNRKILRDQIQDELLDFPLEQRNSIQVETYQSIELRCCKVGEFREQESPVPVYGSLDYRAVSFLNDFGCVICDETHYFLTDSNYNTRTAISFICINRFFENKIRIYMSATIEKVRKYMEDESKKRLVKKTPIYGFASRQVDRFNMGKDCQEKHYDIGRNYNYIDIGIINSKDDIEKVITEERNKKDKWLIFVDNIEYGRQLQSSLQESLKKYNFTITFLSSGYRDDEKESQEVQTIASNSQFSAKILIATAVLDNGVSIKDYDLRNMILIADTETEFIQMLGRKRPDGRKLKLYILRQNKGHFIKRRHVIRNLSKLIQEYMKDFTDKIEREIATESGSLPYGRTMEYYNLLENNLVWKHHCEIMEDIAKRKRSWETISKVFYIFNGTLYLNMLSVRNIENLNQYYAKVIQQLDKDEDAFVRIQLEWLGMTSDADAIVEESKLTLLQKIMNQIDPILDIEKEREDAADFKIRNIRDDLVTLIQRSDIDASKAESLIKDIKKTGRPISEPTMDFLRENFGLPYMVQVKDGMYTFKRVEDENLPDT